MRRSAPFLALIFLLFITTSAQAARSGNYSQLVKTTQAYQLWADDGRSVTSSFVCQVDSFTPDPRAIQIAPATGDSGVRTAQPISFVPYWTVLLPTGQLGMQIYFTFNSLRDVGQWSITCNGTHTDPSYCVSQANPPGFLCDVNYTVPWVNPYTFFVTVFNRPATANISVAGTRRVGSSVTLNPGASDPDHPGSSLRYDWAITGRPSGSTANLSSTTAAAPTLSFGNKHDIGNWSVRLRITDIEGELTEFSSNFQVENQRPTLSVSGPSSIDALQHIHFAAGPSTDADGETISWVWDLTAAPAQAQHQPQSNFSTSQVIDFVTGPKDIGTWQFKCTATDEHNASVSQTATVEVKAIKPQITLTGATRIRVGDSIHVETTTVNDGYGGLLQFRWDILQVPISAGIGLATGYSSGPSEVIPTGPSQAGTWIFKLTVTDQVYQTADQQVSVLVDADPVASILGPDQTGNLSLPLDLDGGSSADPDSPADLPDHGHLHAGSVQISPGIVGYRWSILQVPDELYGTYFPGPVEDVLNVNGGSATLHVPAGKLPTGDWLFELRATDGEGNDAWTTHAVHVLEEGLPPLVVLSQPALYATNAYGVTPVDIVVDGSRSFDLDNLLNSPPALGLGITDYHWDYLSWPTGCSNPPDLADGPSATRATLFAAGSLVAPGCQGVYNVRLTVTDDDTPTAKKNTGSTTVMIGNCPGAICIDYPTGPTPQFIKFSNRTDALIYYHLNSLLYNQPVFASGLRLRMDIFHEGNLVTPVYNRAWDIDLLPSDRGGVLVAHWSGFLNNNARPIPGKYSVSLQLIDAAGNPTGYSATQYDAIWIQTLDVNVAPGSDAYLNGNGLADGTDHLLVNYLVTGQQASQSGFDEMRLSVFDKTTAAKVFENTLPAPYTGSFTWDGGLGASTFLRAGKYGLELEILDGGASLGVSPRYEFRVYKVGLDLAGISAADSLTPGGFITETGTIDVKLTLDSDAATLLGNVRLEALDEPGTLAAKDGAMPVDIDAGVDIPALSLTTAKTYLLTGSAAGSAGKTTVAARYQPPGTTAAKKATAKVAVTVTRTRLRAPSSDASKQATDGVFAAGSTIPVVITAGNFDLFKYQMRPITLEVRPEIPGASVELAYESGSTVNLDLYEADGSHPRVALPKVWTAADFTNHHLVIPLVAYGKSFGEVVLALTYRDGSGTLRGQEKIKLRVEPFPGATGVAIAGEFPYFRVTRTINVGSPVVVGLDPFRHRERLGKKVAVFVVAHKTPAQWASDPSLVDVTGGPKATTVLGPSVANNVTIAWPAAAPGAYDVVYDFGNFTDDPAEFVPDSRLDPGDILDADFGGGPSVTAQSSFTAPGPAAPATAVYGIGGPTTTVLVPAGFDGMVAGFNFRLRGQVVYPATLATAAPLVVFAHGNHIPRTVTTAAFGTQTVSSNLTSDENFKGYTYLQEHLASLGYVTLSVDLDEMYGDVSKGYPAMDGASSSGIKIRAWITLKNIEKLLTDPTIAGGALAGKIDASRIYLLGHSRGGEAVIVALDQLSNPTHRPSGGTLSGVSAAGIKGIISLSPVTQAIVGGGIAPQNVSYLLLYGSADGDVHGASPSVAPFRHYDRALGDRFAIRIVGGDHNHFNTSWGYDDATETVTFGGALGDYSNIVKMLLPTPVGAPATLVNGPAQRDIAKAYISAFLAMLEGTNSTARAFFLEPPTRLRPLGVNPGLTLFSQAELRSSATRKVLDDYESSPIVDTSSSNQNVTTTAADLWEGLLLDTNLATTEVYDRFFQDTRGALLSWSSASEYVEHLAPAEQDLRGAAVISFRVAQQPSHPYTVALGGPMRFSVELEDNAGHKSAMNVDILDSVPSIYPAWVAGPGNTTSAAFETFRLPVAGFAADGADIDLAHITLIRFKFAGPGESATGRAGFDDLEVEK